MPPGQSGVASQSQSISLELVHPVPAEAPVCADVVLQVQVVGAGRDLCGGRIEVLAAEKIVATAELTECRDNVNETAAFAVKAPDRVGRFSWTVRFPAQDIGGIACEERVLQVALRTVPHQTSLAVWSVPSPVRMADRFAIMVGAKSSGGCDLSGARIEVRDDADAKVGDGILGDTLWPGTDALYWTEIAVAAPSRDGTLCWNVEFAAADLALPHLGASVEFSFTSVKPPEHGVTVHVTEQATAAPVAAVQVALGPYRTATDQAGSARIEVPTGSYDLAVWKAGFEACSRAVAVTADMSVHLELTQLPEEINVWT
jgi:hypothetical protein